MPSLKRHVPVLPSRTDASGESEIVILKKKIRIAAGCCGMNVVPARTCTTSRNKNFALLRPHVFVSFFFTRSTQTRLNDGINESGRSSV